MITNKALLLQTLCLLMSAITAYSQNVVTVSPVTLKNIGSLPYSYATADTRMNGVVLGDDYFFRDSEVKNYVRLAIDPNEDDYITGDPVYEVTVEIKYWTVTGISYDSPITEVETLKISLNEDNSDNYHIDINEYRFNNAYKVSTKITGIKKDGVAVTSISSLPNSFYIETGIEVTRFEDFDPEVVAEDFEVTYNSSNQLIRIKDFTIPGAVAYDIEWTCVSNYSYEGYPSSVLGPTVLSYIFHNNSSRIRVYSDETINLPGVFDAGYVIVRIRGIGRDIYNDLDHDWYGNWSTLDHYDALETTPRTISSITGLTHDPYILIGSGVKVIHEKEKNWNYTVAFAEEGKMKHTVSYFDGTGKVRQSVTLANTENEVLVAETFYDHQGRPAVQSLPVPVPRDAGSPTIPILTMKYYENFNTSDADDEKFGMEDFDMDAEGDECVPVINPFATDQGAGKYYSPNNVYQVYENAFIPNAEGYAYSLTEYMPDNTGRIRQVAGVGPDHHLNSGHTTNYFYGKPSQEELDRLFGTNVGYASHYQKNMVIDPNGQVSVSYVDMKGNVIATALAGETPDNVDPLYVDGTTTTLYADASDLFDRDLLDKSTEFPQGSSNLLSPDGKSLTHSSTLLVTSSSDYEFSYSLSEEDFTPECLTSKCYDCVYDLHITVVDQCGDELLSQTAVIGDMPLDGESDNETCSATSFSLSGTGMDISSLPVGSYQVIKTLTVNEEALNYYANIYAEAMVADETCGLDFDDFLDDAESEFDGLDCELTCEDCDALGTLEDFLLDYEYEIADVSAGVADAVAIQEAYYSLVSLCSEMCDSKGNDFCYASYIMMLQDMSPNGQYGQLINEATGEIDPSEFVLSVYNGENILQARTSSFGTIISGYTSWEYPVRQIDGTWVKGYYTEDGSERPKIYLTDGEDGALFSPDVSWWSTETVDGITYYYSYPEFLENLSDFYSLWEPSWAHSLVAYHPEYFYYQECALLYHEDFETDISADCSSCNTFQYDEYLLSLDILTVSSGFEQIQDFDPMFDITSAEAFETTYMDSYVICDATTISIWHMAWLMDNPDLYTLETDCGFISDLGGTPTPASYITTQGALDNLVMLYIGKKYEYWLSQADAEMDDVDFRAYNGCIGVPYAYQYKSTGFSPLDFEELIEDDYVCGLPAGVFYTDKVRRFTNGYAALGLDSEEDLSDLSEDLLDEADLYYYLETGNMPLAFDVEIFLNGAISLGSDWYDPTTPYDFWIIETLTPRLAEELDAISTTGDWDPSVTTVSTTSTLEWKLDGSTVCLTLEETESAYDFSDILSFHNILTTDAGAGEFTIKATVLDGMSDEVDITLEGSICVGLDDMSFYTADCNLTPEMEALMALMNILIDNEDFDMYPADEIGTYGTSMISLTELFEPFFSPFIGPGTVAYEWEESGDTYTLTGLDGSITIVFSSSPVGSFLSAEAVSDPEYAGPTNDILFHTDNPSVPTDFYASILWTSGETTYDFPAANCDFDIEIFCNDEEHYVRNDLEILLDQLFSSVGDDYHSEEITLEGTTYGDYYTPLLEWYSGSTTSEDFWQVVNEDEQTLEIVIGSTSNHKPEDECHLTFTISDPSTVSVLNGSDITDLVSLVADFSYATGDVTYDFDLVLSGVSSELVYVDGHSTCFPLKNCEDCLDEPTVIEELESTLKVTYSHDTSSNSAMALVEIAGMNTDTLFSQSMGGAFDTLRVITSAGSSVLDTSYVMPGKSLIFSAGTALVLADIIENAITSSAMAMYTLKLIIGDDFTPDEAPAYDSDCDPDIQPFPEVEYTNDCAVNQLMNAYSNATTSYDIYVAALIDDFKAEYISHCMSAIETFDVAYSSGEYQYTLYYYDQSGNLVQTVPPTGVDILASTSYDDVDSYRATAAPTTTTVPSHTMETKYAYNSLGNLIWQDSPDGGTSEFYYDALGRLTVSQNEKQEVAFTPSGETGDYKKYSYTAFDNLGRITEVGELWTDSFNPQTQIDADNVPGTWADYRRTVVSTYYDSEDALGLTTSPFASGATYLRNRVASVTLEEIADTDNTTYDHGSHYSYDIHGNVHHLIQENQLLAANFPDQQFKHLKYTYDLISGNVNQVRFQPEEIDQFYHKYAYDADNRIKEVFTSRDGIIWEQDARYTYYRHGPLARTELGDLFVQGVDYAYTIHGWLKGVNSGALNTGRDMGGDAKSTGIRKMTGTDAFGFILHYYDGDYAQIGSVNSFIPAASTSGTGYNLVTESLFNGNIRAMTTALMRETHDKVDVVGAAYTYDQLNRLTSRSTYIKSNMHLSGNFTWSAVSESPKWSSAYSYDGNGNLLTLERAGNNATTSYDMDDLTYNYYPNTNQLGRVDDAISGSAYADDIDDQTGSNYTYDEIGNLIADVQGDITEITWNVQGKISSIDKGSGPDLTFAYDAMGNRIMKLVDDGTDLMYTYYVRDAQGNVMATYTREDLASTDSIFLSEQHIYGSSRLGYVSGRQTMTAALPTDGMFFRKLGQKRYELTNHLGNVLVVITDRRLLIEGTGGTAGKIKSAEPDVVQANDYYPFGLMMSGRSWSEGYRFGFNGQEQDDEVYGEGILNTALYWEYDTRLGRRWNVDPVVIPGRSPYLAFDDNPIFFTDIYGDSEDGPGGRRAMKRAERKIDKLERKGYHGWIADQVDNDGRLDIAFTGKDESGDYFVGGASEKLNIIDRISNGFSNGDAWVHSDDGEQFGQGVNSFNPAIELINVGSGIATGDNIYNQKMTGVDYTFAVISIIPVGKIGGLGGKMFNRGLIKFTTSKGAEASYEIWHTGGDDVTSYLAKKKWTVEEVSKVIENNNWVIHRTPAENQITGKGMKRFIHPDSPGKDLIIDDDGVIIQLGKEGYNWAKKY